MSFVNGLANSQGFKDAAGNIVPNIAGLASSTQQGLPAGGQDLTGVSPLQSTVDQAHVMTDPNHPFWDVMQSITGQPGAAQLQSGIPAQPMQGLEDGGSVTRSDTSPNGRPRFIVQGGVKEAAAAVGKTMATGIGMVGNAAKDLKTHPASDVDASDAYQNGGVVKLNSGSQTIRPAFTQGPAIAVGPNSGIVPASTEGQVLTMESGGPVENGAIPNGFQEAGGGPQPQVSGFAAGLAGGIGRGQAIGNNLINAWHTHEARQAVADAAGKDTSFSDQNPQGGLDQATQPTLLDKAKQAVESVFHHIHSGNLDDDGKPNGATPPAAIPAPGAAPASASPVPTAPAQPAAAGAPVPGAPPGAGAVPPGAAPVAGTPPAQPQGAPPAAVPQAGATPASGSTNPAQPAATADAIATAKASPQAQTGTPEKTPASSGQPHSLTADYWRESDARIAKAVSAAAMAGQDPHQVYNALTALRTSNIQGHVLKNLAAANTALLNGDEDSVRKALENVNYYLPNGQGMQFHNATAQEAAADTTGTTKPGQLMYRNPMFGLYGHQGEPEYQSVTPQHLQLLGTAALDPMNVQNTVLKTYQAQAQAQKEMLGAKGEYMTGQGRLALGNARFGEMQLKQRGVAIDDYLKFATGQQHEAEANWYSQRGPGGAGDGRPKVTTSNIMQAQKAAREAVDSQVQGQFTTAPLNNPDGSPNISVAAGKPVHDATRIPPLYQGLTPEAQSKIENLGGQIAGANIGVYSPQESGDIAARIVRYEQSGGKSTHANPQTGKPEKDIVYDPKKGTVHVWVGNGWKNAYLQPNVADEGGAGIPPSSGGSAGSEDNGADDTNVMQ